MSEQTYSCQQCGKQWRRGDLRPVSHLFERVEPGECMPAGECADRDCGALCFPVKDRWEEFCDRYDLSSEDDVIARKCVTVVRAIVTRWGYDIVNDTGSPPATAGIMQVFRAAFPPEWGVLPAPDENIQTCPACKHVIRRT